MSISCRFHTHWTICLKFILVCPVSETLSQMSHSLYELDGRIFFNCKISIMTEASPPGCCCDQVCVTLTHVPLVKLQEAQRQHAAKLMAAGEVERAAELLLRAGAPQEAAVALARSALPAAANLIRRLVDNHGGSSRALPSDAPLADAAHGPVTLGASAADDAAGDDVAHGALRAYLSTAQGVRSTSSTAEARPGRAPLGKAPPATDATTHEPAGNNVPGVTLDRATALWLADERRVQAEQQSQQAAPASRHVAPPFTSCQPPMPVPASCDSVHLGSRQAAAVELGIAPWRGGPVPMHVGMAEFSPAHSHPASGADLPLEGEFSFQKDLAGGSEAAHKATSAADSGLEAEGGNEAGQAKGGFTTILNGHEDMPARLASDTEVRNSDGRREDGGGVYSRRQCLRIYAAMTAPAATSVVQHTQQDQGVSLPAEGERALREMELLLPPQPVGTLPQPPSG